MSNYLTENLRTVALVGHSASGKTSLVEAMLVRTGAIAEAGSVERGNTVCDNDPQRRKPYAAQQGGSLLRPLPLHPQDVAAAAAGKSHR